MTSGKRQQGFTYLAALFLVGLAGLGLATTAELWSHSRQRDKETELIWVGEQFRQAIGLYYQRSPGDVKRFPEKLEDLLEDRRYLTMQRYLRKLYADPITGKADWGIVAAPGGGIMGVYSRSARSPIRVLLRAGKENPSGSVTYENWRFVYEPLELTQSTLPAQKPAVMK